MLSLLGTFVSIESWTSQIDVASIRESFPSSHGCTLFIYPCLTYIVFEFYPMISVHDADTSNNVLNSVGVGRMSLFVMSIVRNVLGYAADLTNINTDGGALIAPIFHLDSLEARVVMEKSTSISLNLLVGYFKFFIGALNNGFSLFETLSSIIHNPEALNSIENDQVD